jgi:hypothetical protein
VSLSLPLAKAFAPLLPGPGGKPALARYLGHGETATWALRQAEAAGAATLVAAERGLMADLYWFGTSSPLVLRTIPPAGPPGHHWELVAAFDAGTDPGPVILLWPEGTAAPCPGATSVASLVAPPGAYQGRRFLLLRLAAPECLVTKEIPG